MVITGTRAEYGLLKNTIEAINNDNELNLQLVVTGTHLSEKYGYTVNEIISDGYKIDETIPILEEDNNKLPTEMGKLMIKLNEVYAKLKPDILLILGDRYEIFAAASAAMVMNIPIAHISGGEITEGAIDEQIRHSITKMAHIHFPGAEEYAENIRRMGEEEWRIFNVGDPGIENIRRTKLLTTEEIEKRLGIKLDDDVMLLTFHPVTLEIDNTEQYIKNLLEAVGKTRKQVIITYPNSDVGGCIIIDKILEFEHRYKKALVVKSLGSLLYLSVLNKCGAVVGNSSSGIVEAPFMKKPVVNVGNRQLGRLMANNIINCGYDTESIYNALVKAYSKEFRNEVILNTKSFYGEGDTSLKIVQVLKDIKIDQNLIRKKLKWD